MPLDQPVDFVIITALEEEREAMLSKLPGHRKLEKDGLDIHTYYSAVIETTRSDRAQYNIIVTSLLGMGPSYAAGKAAAVVARWNPRYVLLVGIAAGVPDKVALGDVLVARNIADYTLGKQEKDGRRSIRWQQFHPDGNLVDSANNLKTGWESLVKGTRPSSGIPTRHVDTIASGPDVIECDQVVHEYSTEWSKLIGIEMEGGAVAIAFYQLPDPPGYLMIRGVSDFAEDKNTPKTKAWRPYACETASAYTLALLREGPIPAASRPEPVVSAPENVSVSGSISEGFSEIKKEIEDLRLSLDIRPKNLPKDIQGFLGQLEGDNPALDFSAETTVKGTTYKIQAKKGTAPTNIGELGFPETDAGRVGAEKFRQATEEGRAIEFEPGEYIWNPAIKIPNSVDEERRALRISPNVPVAKPLVNIRWLDPQDAVLAEIKSAVLSVIRIGSKEVEFKLTGGRLAGTLNLMLDRAAQAGKINFILDLPSQSAAVAIETVNLFLSFYAQGRIQISSLETDSPLFELSSLGIPKDSKISKRNLEDTKKLLTAISVINEEFNLDIRYPVDVADPKSAFTADLLVAAKRKGRIAVLAEPEEKFQMSCTKEEIQKYLQLWKAHKTLNFNIQPIVPYVIFGQEIPVGPVKWQYEGVMPTKSLKKLEEQVSKGDKAQTITVDLKYVRVIHEIERFLKK